MMFIPNSGRWFYVTNSNTILMVLIVIQFVKASVIRL